MKHCSKGNIASGLLGVCMRSSRERTLPIKIAPSGKGMKSSQAVLPTPSSQDSTLLGLKAQASTLVPSQYTSVGPEVGK